MLTIIIGVPSCLGAHSHSTRPWSMNDSSLSLYPPFHSMRIGFLNTSLWRNVTTAYTQLDCQFRAVGCSLPASCPVRSRLLRSMLHQ